MQTKLTADQLFARNPIAAAMLSGTMLICRKRQQQAVRTAKPAPVRKPDPHDAALAVAEVAARHHRWSSSSMSRQGMGR